MNEVKALGKWMPVNAVGNVGAQQQMILVAICAISQMGSRMLVSERRKQTELATATFVRDGNSCER